jgi:hypothetical protein
VVRLRRLIGCDNIKTRLAEYEAVIAAASQAGRDPIDDLALTFCFQGSPGTGKTTIARRMGMLFEALGVLPSADVVQVSASDFSTGFVGQAAAKTRDIFDSARGAVLFVDEGACPAIRLKPPPAALLLAAARRLVCSQLKGVLLTDVAAWTEQRTGCTTRWVARTCRRQSTRL